MKPSVTANNVYHQLLDDFPQKDASWVKNQDVSWKPPSSVHTSQIDFSSADQWNAAKHTAKIAKFMRKIKKGDKKPVVLARVPGKNNGLIVLDGHHRTLASKKLGVPVHAYIADVGEQSKESALEMHASQKQGNSGTPKSDEVKFSNEIELTAETPVASSVPHPFSKKPKPGLWHVTGMELDPYIQNVGHALLRSGSATDTSDAIHKAYGIVKGWAAGVGAGGKYKVTPQVQAAAAGAIARMDAKRARAHAATAKRHSSEHSNDHQETLDMADLRKIEEMDIPHKHPAPVRKVMKQLMKSGQAKNHADALAQAQKLFQQWASGNDGQGGSVPPITQLAAKKVLGGWTRGKPKLAREDFDVKQLANEHHDELGKFTHRPPVPAYIEVLSPQEETVRDFQRMHGLPETGKLDAATDKLYREAF